MRATRNGQPSRKSRNLEALIALTYEMMATIRCGHIAGYVGDGADAMQVRRGWLRHLRVALHQNTDLTLLLHRLLGTGDRPWPADADRQHQPGEQDSISHRQNDQRIRRNQFDAGGARPLIACGGFAVTHLLPPSCPV